MKTPKAWMNQIGISVTPLSGRPDRRRIPIQAHTAVINAEKAQHAENRCPVGSSPLRDDESDGYEDGEQEPDHGKRAANEERKASSGTV
jgi:hypothetical protein